MLDAKDPETGEGLSDTDIVDNILTFIGAGHETTALALTWTFFLLSSHPEIEARILAEIAQVTGGGPVEAAHVADLTYTRQAIQESMRVYPPVAMVVRQAIAPFTLGDQQVGTGDNVFIPIYAVHHHKTLWEHPDRFDPDRFAPDLVKARHRYSYLPFGAGPRICVGASFALTEAVLVLSAVLARFRIGFAGPGTVLPLGRVTTQPDRPVRFVLSPRAALTGSVRPPISASVQRSAAA